MKFASIKGTGLGEGTYSKTVWRSFSVKGKGGCRGERSSLGLESFTVFLQFVQTALKNDQFGFRLRKAHSINF